MKAGYRATAFIALSALQTITGSPRGPPHVLYILVDDLGWGDVGFNRDVPSPEVLTPNMDKLVREGIHLHRHYVHSTCTGTRVSAQSGRLPVHATTSLRNPEEPNSGMPRNMTGIAEVLAKANYSTHFVGKWDVGMATHKHTPRGRGYSTSLGYFEHKNDYWTQKCYQSKCCRDYGLLEGRTEGPYYDLNITDLWRDDGPASDLNGTDYEEFIFLRRIEELLDAHNQEEPLFLFYAPHIAHCPLQVPEEYLEKFSFMQDDEGQCHAQTPNVLPIDPPTFTFHCRRQYRGMVNLLDDIVGKVVSKLKAKGLWDNMLLVFTSDNGGPTKLEESGATNHPLRGGKYSYFEGGVRAAAFVSGGAIPQAQRGTSLQEMIHIADWYATLASLAGVSPTDQLAAISGLPPVDGVNVWPLIAGETAQSPRGELPLGKSAIIRGQWKLLLGDQHGAAWHGPDYPNASSHGDDPVLQCGDRGCLFDVVADPTEHEDVRETHQSVAHELSARLQALAAGFFDNNDRGVDSCPAGIEMPCACWMAINHYGGFFGPYQEIDMAASPASGLGSNAAEHMELVV